MWPFKKSKPESPEEKQALENLDEATREVAGAEMEKAAFRIAALAPGTVGPVGAEQAAQIMVHGDPDPPDDRSMHDVMHEDEPKP